jgi:sugar phosphate isomerase/epimerase
MLEATLGYERAVGYLCRAGFEAIDYSLINPDLPIFGDDRKNIIKRLREIASSFGVSFNQSHAPYPRIKLGEGFEDYNRIATARNMDAIEISGELGIPGIVIHPICYRPLDRVYNAERNIEDMRPLFALANECGVKILLENMFSRREENKASIIPGVVSFADELLWFSEQCAAEFGKESVGICYDIGHSGLVGEAADSAILALGGRITALHIHDNDFVRDRHTFPFFGDLDFGKVTDALATVGYSGDITFEPDVFARIPEQLYMPALKYLYSVGDYLRECIREKCIKLQNS